MKDRKNVTHEYKVISTKDLLVDDMYQRDLDPKRVARIVKNFDPCLANVVKVSFRDNKYWIFDGNHTVHAAKAVFASGRDILVECKVFYGLSRADEMELFLAQNGDASPVKIAAKLRALYNNGDQDVVSMVENTAKAGVRIDPKFAASSGISTIKAYSTIRKIYMRFKAKGAVYSYIDMLNTINTAWDGSPDSFVEEILRGMAKFYEIYAGEFKSNELIKSLRRISPSQIVREGKSLISGSTTDAGYARCIVRAYNAGRRNRLEDKV